MTLTADARNGAPGGVGGRSSASDRQGRPHPPGQPTRRAEADQRPVEFWPTSSIRAALEMDDLATWQRIVTAIKRDPYGRTARQVEEVLEAAHPVGVSKAMAEVLSRTREHLVENECAEVARHVRAMLERSGLAAAEFASRIGIPGGEFGRYVGGDACPSASLMIRMRRLSDRFARMRAERAESDPD